MGKGIVCSRVCVEPEDNSSDNYNSGNCLTINNKLSKLNRKNTEMRWNTYRS